MAPHALQHGYPTPLATPPSERADGFNDTPFVALASTRAVVAGKVTPATIVISTVTGKIIEVHDSIIPAARCPAGTAYIDHSPHLLLPGLVDAHVHLNEPGRTEWEGFETGTKAAAFGGVTTVIDMPLNAIPPTTTCANFDEKLRAAQGKCWVDVGFYGGMIPGNASELKGLVRKGVRGFKGFLIDSGVDEFPAVRTEDVTRAMLELADEPTTLMFHAEAIPPISDSVGDDVQWSLPPLRPTGPLNTYQTFLDSRPTSFEEYAIAEILSLAHLAPSLALHIVHLSAVESIPLLRDARARGVKITAETCPHYLSLAAEAIKDGDTRHKCCPPIRGQTNQDGLWDEMLRPDDSVIKTVVSDHSPCTPNLKLLPKHIPGAISSSESVADKEGDFFSAWGGISSVGLGLPILWTEHVKRGFTIEQVVRWCCEATARQVGLEHRKGSIAVGMDADIAVFDDEAEWLVQPNTMLFRNKCSPYEGRTLQGMVRETWLAGRRIYSRQDGFDLKTGAQGKLLLERRTN